MSSFISAYDTIYNTSTFRIPKPITDIIEEEYQTTLERYRKYMKGKQGLNNLKTAQMSQSIPKFLDFKEPMLTLNEELESNRRIKIGIDNLLKKAKLDCLQLLIEAKEKEQEELQKMISADYIADRTFQRSIDILPPALNERSDELKKQIKLFIRKTYEEKLFNDTVEIEIELQTKLQQKEKER